MEISLYQRVRFRNGHDENKFKTTTDIETIERENLSDTYKLPNPSRHFSHLFNAYTRSFNFGKNRRGGLFERPFKRKIITNEEYLRYLVYYIHHNPLKHGFVHDFKEYTWSSYKAFIKGDFGFLEANYILSLFGDIKNFVWFHKHEHDLGTINDLME